MKISIITINLNDKEGLQQTIDSVANQTFTDYEFIVIDGNSSDGSVDVLKANESKISKWISEPDTGIYNAMNKGIKIAKGEYLYFLNAGDRLYSENVLHNVFEDNPNSSFICGNFYTENKGQVTLETPYRNRDWSFSLYDIYSTYLCHQAFFIRKDNFDKYGLYSEDLRITADWELFLMAIGVNHEKVEYKDINLVIYNLEGLSSTIGGKIIYEEKRKVAQRRLSATLANKLDRLYFLEQNGYITDAVKDSSILSFFVRVYYKLKRMF